MGVIALKCALAAFVGALAIWLPGSHRILRLEQRTYRGALWTLAAGSRFGLFLVLYVVLGLGVPSDVSGYYVPEAQAALSGQLVYRDFASSYGPGFPYVVGLLLRVTGSPQALVAVAIAFELAAFGVWGRLAREIGYGETSVRRGELLYVTSAVPLLTVAVAGQNQPWLALSVGLSLLLALRGATVLAAGAALAGALLVKALAVPFFLPAAWLLARRGKKSAWSFVAIVTLGAVVCAGVLATLGADVTVPLRREATLASPGNLPLLLSVLLAPLGLSFPRWLGWLGFALAALWLVRRSASQEPDRARAVWGSMATVWLAFLALAPKAFPGYFVIAALPIAMVAAVSRSRRTVYAVWQAALAVLPSIWFRLFDDAPEHDKTSWPGMALLVLLHAATIGGALWLLVQAGPSADDEP